MDGRMEGWKEWKESELKGKNDKRRKIETKILRDEEREQAKEKHINKEREQQRKR